MIVELGGQRRGGMLHSPQQQAVGCVCEVASTGWGAHQVVFPSLGGVNALCYKL